MLSRRKFVASGGAAVVAPLPALALSHGAPAAQHGGVPVTFSAQAQQFFDRLLTPPPLHIGAMYNTLITSLVTAGVWALLDGLYIAAANGDASLINLVSASYQAIPDFATLVPVFTPNKGWSGFAAPGASDINSNFNPSTAGGNYSQNSAMVAAWQIENAQNNQPLVTDFPNTFKINLQDWTDGNVYYGVNEVSGNVHVAAPADLSGFWLTQRTSSSAIALYHNAVSIGTAATTSAALENAVIIANPTGSTLACLAFGASLSGAQITAFYNAVQAYLHSIGAV